jgi:hypothetical protein
LQSSKKENGSAGVDFILTATPLTLVFISAISICSSAYVLGVIRDSAVEGARFAALADQSSTDGCQKALSLMKQVLVSVIDPRVSCRLVDINSSSFEKVEIEVSVPFINSLFNSSVLRAEGWAPRENQ